MPNRVQTLRSSVTGAMPQAATRSPGELWLNFADAHLGYIDATQTAQKLLAVRLFVNTASYATGDFVVYAGALYQATAPSAAGAFTAANWTKLGTAQDLAQYLPLAGGTLSGALTLPAAAPVNANQATNKSYVDAGDASVLSAANAAANSKLPLAGGTLTGALNGTTATFSGVLAAASVSAGPATFSGVATAADPPDGDSSNKLVTTEWFVRNIPAVKENVNRIINGDMLISQRNGNTAITPTNSSYTADRWLYGLTQASKFSINRPPAQPTTIPFGFPYFLQAISQSAYTPLATDAHWIGQRIEGDMVADFLWGTANAQPATLSFWANVSVAGTYSGAVANGPNSTRSYPFTFTLAAAGLQKVVVPIPGDTAGTWTLNGNGDGMELRFDLGSGANFRGAAGAWTSGNIVGVTGAINTVAINGGIFAFTGVKLEIGNVATPFNRQSLTKSLADCQRYYQVLNGLIVAGYTVGTMWATVTNATTMRATPTTAVVGTPAYGNASALATQSMTPTGFQLIATQSAAGVGWAQGNIALTAEL